MTNRQKNAGWQEFFHPTKVKMNGHISCPEAFATKVVETK